MKRVSIYLDEDQINFLDRESERKDMSIAKYIRELVQREMAKEKERRKDPFWKIGEDEFSTGNKRGSIEHDKIIYRPKWVNT
ncbi:MAG TPA: CopG family transcriptional regulator [Thermodesulfobacteriota bacterium]|nr:CopG family transcriptional regulator [Thermodesulfobacteriota bacterium]